MRMKNCLLLPEIGVYSFPTIRVIEFPFIDKVKLFAFSAGKV